MRRLRREDASGGVGERYKRSRQRPKTTGVFDGDAALFERRADQAEVFKGDMTKGEHAFGKRARHACRRGYFWATWK